MLRASNYNLYYRLDKPENEYLLFHGYSGAVDAVTEDVYQALLNPERIASLDGEVRATLLRRGYLTEKDSDGERQVFKKVAEALAKAGRKWYELTFLPTYNCNFRCEYCFEKHVMEKGAAWLTKKLEPETVDAVLNQVDQLREEGYTIQNVSLFGGEPLLKSNYGIVDYIVQHCRQREMNIQAITNGYDLDQMLALLGKAKISSLQITLDGTAEIHNQRRYLAGGQPTFQKITANIELALQRTDVRIVVRSNISASNLDKVEELMAFYREKGWLNQPNFDYYFKSTHKCYEADPTNIVTDPQVMERIAKVAGTQNHFHLSTYYSALSRKCQMIFEKKAVAPFTPTHCGAVNGMIVADPYGDIYPCWDVIGNPEEKIGVVDYQQQLIRFNAKNDLWLNRIVSNIEECVACPYALLCGGGCAAHAQYTTSDAYSPYCDSFKQIFDEVFPAVYQHYAAKESLEKAG